MAKRISLLLVFLVLVFLVPITAAAKMVSVTGDNVNLRSGPGTKYSVKWKYGSGFPLKVLQEKGDWLKVEDFEGDSGWLYKKLTSRTGHMIVKVHKDQDTKINIRSGPGTKYKSWARLTTVLFSGLSSSRTAGLTSSTTAGSKDGSNERFCGGSE